MKRRLLIAIYALLHVAGIAYHYGPGQQGVSLDTVQSLLGQAEKAYAAEDFTKSKDFYEQALAAVPTGQSELAAKIQVLKAETRMMDGEVPEAILDLETAMTTAAAEGVSQETQDKLRAQKSTAHYYAAWLVRLENVSEDEWENQCDQARQGFRYLAEKSTDSGLVAAAGDHQKSLESAIRLAQMDAADLKALPLPKSCAN